MGITVEMWRARIGSYCTGGNNLLLFVFPASKLVSGLYVSLATILLLLVIGNIELNPGPEDLYACIHCNFIARTAREHIYHQQLHSDLFNFRFRCPFPPCLHSYTSFKCVQAHLSHHSTVNVEEVVNQAADTSIHCAHCVEKLGTNRAYCKHLKEHLKNGSSLPCPFSSCSRSDEFTSLSVFSTHLSQCHPGWLQDYSTSLRRARNVPGAEVFDPYVGTIDNEEGETRYGSAPGSDSSSDSSDNSDQSDMDLGVDHDDVVAFIAHFYAMLEGKKVVPSSTVDSLAKKLAILSEILQVKLKKDLKRSLTQAGLPEETIQQVIGSVLSMDPLYNAHHVHAHGETLLTSARRLTYYKNNFKHLDFEEINLKRNPRDTEDKIQYVDVRETLRVMLEDPTVKKAVRQSFNAPDSDGTVLRDYTDGSVFRNSSTPKKRIDLLFFMDAYSCTNSLGSAKRKHKMHGMYMTLGNLKPYMRSFLRSMRLILLVNDKSLKKGEKMYKKCFKRVMKDVKNLEEHGLDFDGEKIAVRLQFIQGDNLGQNILGGFVESFTNTYFCRFCDKHYDEFKADAAEEKPKPRRGEWRTPESYNEDLRQQESENLHNSHGVKRDSPFHQLNHFHVCEPRLAPCIGHDLFVDGVVDNDVRSMIDYFIAEKWFTLPELNMRIKRFKFLGKDSANRPAELPENSLKLGGHIVQNWTLFRLLPLLIMDKIKPEDKTWKLYLLLKSIIELVSAPSLSNEQIELMRRLIKKYWRKRLILRNSNFKPKHHMFSHFPDLYLRLGPLIFMWTMAFEHRHQFFKRVAKICNNFVNLGHLLVSKYLLLEAYQNMGPMFPETPVFGQTSLLQEQDEALENDLQDFIKSSNFSQDAVKVKNLTLNEIKYKENDWLLLGYDVTFNPKVLSVGQIQVLVFDNNVCTAIVKKFNVEENTQLGLHCVTNSHPEFKTVILEQLENPVQQSVYTLQGKNWFSLKHVFVN